MKFIRRALILMAFPAALAATAAAAERTLESEAVVGAPVADVWNAFVTNEGFSSWAVAKAQIDLRVGGDIRTSYVPQSTLDDESTIVNRIISYEPQRMLSIQNVQAPKAFKNAELFQQTWTVMYFEPIAADRTSVRVVGLGFGEGPDWDDLYNKFKAGNAYTLQKLQKKFAPPPPASANGTGAAAGGVQIDPHNVTRGGDSAADAGDSQRVLELLGRLVGGEWIHESTRPDGSLFRARNVFKHGPDEVSVIGAGWLGDAQGMSPHGSSQVYREPGTGRVLFQSIDENGAVASGGIRLLEPDTVEWDWSMRALDGKHANFRVQMHFLEQDRYQFRLFHKGEGEQWTQLFQLEYTRVDRAPEAFLTIRSSN